MSNTRGRLVDDEYSQFLVDQVAVMVKKEDVFYACTDYLGELPESKGDSVDESWRQKVAEWMFKVIDYYVSDIRFVDSSMKGYDSHLVFLPRNSGSGLGPRHRKFQHGISRSNVYTFSTAPSTGQGEL